MSFFDKYNKLLKTHPFRVNMVTTGVLFGIGDAIAQKLFPLNHDHLDEEKPKYNPHRTMRAMIYGSCFFAPCGVLWYGKRLPLIKNPFVSVKSRKTWSKNRVHLYDTLYRVTIDQLFIPGLFWIPMYNIVMSTLSGYENPLEVAFQKLQHNWWNVLTTNWMVWPGFQLVSFFYIPVHLRIVAANICSVGWNCFLSYLYNGKAHGDHQKEEILDHLVDPGEEIEETTMVVY